MLLPNNRMVVPHRQPNPADQEWMEPGNLIHTFRPIPEPWDGYHNFSPSKVPLVVMFVVVVIDMGSLERAYKLKVKYEKFYET